MINKSLNIPRIGIAVLVVKDNKILLGKRKNSHGDATWAPPGGHLEFGESLEECTKREVLEETGLKVKNFYKFDFTSDIFISENKHYISIFMMVTVFIGEPKVLEPDKCEIWLWFNIDQLPNNLFLPLKNLLLQKQINFNVL